MAVDHFFGCTSTKTGSIIIGCINMALSVINIIVFILYLVLILAVGTRFGVSGHGIFIVFYVFIGIGMLSSLLQLIFSIMLVKGVKSREPKWVRIYMIVGTISLFFSLISLILGFFNVASLIWAICVAVVQVYFLIVVHSEYKNILAEKQTQNVGEFPTVAVAQKPVEFR